MCRLSYCVPPLCLIASMSTLKAAREGGSSVPALSRSDSDIMARSRSAQAASEKLQITKWRSGLDSGGLVQMTSSRFARCVLFFLYSIFFLLLNSKDGRDSILSNVNSKEYFSPVVALLHCTVSHRCDSTLTGEYHFEVGGVVVANSLSFFFSHHQVQKSLSLNMALFWQAVICLLHNKNSRLLSAGCFK